jgi:chromosome segregation ATPase
VEGLRRERVQLDSQVQRGKRIAEESQEEHSKVLIRVKQQEETIRQYESSSLGREVYDANTAAELSARVKECATLQGELHRLESVLKQRIGTQEDTQLALDNAESRIASLNDNLRTQTHAEAAAREERAAANRTLEQLQSHRDDADRVASQARQGQVGLQHSASPDVFQCSHTSVCVSLSG